MLTGLMMLVEQAIPVKLLVLANLTVLVDLIVPVEKVDGEGR